MYWYGLIKQRMKMLAMEVDVLMTQSEKAEMDLANMNAYEGK